MCSSDLCMYRRCQEAEGLTALADDNALIKVSQSVNAARYVESTLTQWCEDVFFLEMENIPLDGEGESVFQKEIHQLEEFRSEWVDKLSTVILRAFDARSRDYLNNKRQWHEHSEEPAISRAIIESSSYVQGRLCKLEEGLKSAGLRNSMESCGSWSRPAAFCRNFHWKPEVQ